MTARTVRRAVERDVPDLVRLRAEMFRAMGTPGHDAPSWQAAAAGWFTERIGDPRFCFAVVETGGAVVATAMGILRESAPSPGSSEGDALIGNVCTDPGARRQGHARAAFDEVVAWAAESGAGRAELMATDEGRGMYEAAGFRVTHAPAMRAVLRTNAR
ncbi:GNAT family N-acetyltransferase [Pseudonocardia phyllosphaerae]|uniref:GNAT family N-acetyltransferase n=1 Tax=Pseudonocardia phyllosphaerae TaxID=3390502 RepID=UPI00397CFE50